MKTKLCSFYQLINTLVLVCGTAAVIGLWDKLPYRIPIHFGLDGKPNRWTEKGTELLVLFVLPWVFTSGIHFMSKWVHNHPKWINMPYKKDFLKLTDEQKEPFLCLLDEFFAGMCFIFTIFFAAIIYGFFEVALGIRSELFPWLWMLAVLLVVFQIAYVVRIVLFSRKFKEMASLKVEI